MSFLRVFGHLGWFWFPCPRKGSYVRPSLFHGRPRSDVGEKNTISPHWLLVKDLIWIIFQELKVEKSINDTFMTILNVDEWDHWDPNDPQWHDQKLKPEIQHRPFINWARYLSSIPRCYAASPWTTVQPVARQIGHGTANRAGPLRQRKRARSCLELCENHHEISWMFERWQFIDVNHMIRSVFCPMKGIVLQHRAWTCS